jgi:hypothetical protein
VDTGGRERDRSAEWRTVSSSLSAEYETPLNTWARVVDRADLTARLAADYQLSTSGGGIINKYDSMYPRSTGQRTSIAVQACSEAPSTTASDNVPSLTGGSSSASSSSAETDFASALDGMPTLESVNGALEVPDTSRPDADLICPFQILNCEEMFRDIRLWKTHVFSHFRAQPCPTTATCFLCDSVFNQSRHDDPERAWNEMLQHMAIDHFRGMGQRLATVRTDFALMRWMFNRHIITPAQFRQMQLIPLPIVLPGSAGHIVEMPEAPMAPPRPSSVSGSDRQSDIYTVQASARRERRTRSNRRP